MNKLTRVLLVIALVGVIFGAIGTSDTILFFKGTTVDLTDPISSFDKKALAQGDIDFVYGPFATLETSQKHYGITTSKTETDFFIVSNLDAGEAFVVFSTSKDSLREELSKASDQWVDWFNSEDEDTPPPEIKISFRGKLAKQRTEDDYIKYLNEAKDDLSNIGIQSSEFAEMEIVYGEISVGSVVFCFAGYGIALISLIIILITFIKAKKEAKAAELY